MTGANVSDEGDSSAAVDFPHGNAKLARAVSRPYVRTQPHVLKDIQTQASSSAGPRDVYRSLVAERPTGERQEVVRDTEQVRSSVQYTPSNDEPTCVNVIMSKSNNYRTD